MKKLILIIILIVGCKETVTESVNDNDLLGYWNPIKMNERSYTDNYGALQGFECSNWSIEKSTYDIIMEKYNGVDSYDSHIFFGESDSVRGYLKLFKDDSTSTENINGIWMKTDNAICIEQNEKGKNTSDCNCWNYKLSTDKQELVLSNICGYSCVDLYFTKQNTN